MLPMPLRFALLAACISCACASQRATGQGQEWALARRADPTGARVYDAHCAGCHGATGEGARGIPALVGAEALVFQRGKRQEGKTFQTAQDVFDYTSTKMPLPPKRVGSLSERDYWAVVSFLLRAKGASLPPGGLTPLNARSIMVN
jgi:mono/diheme cytochrome c family protein